MDKINKAVEFLSEKKILKKSDVGYIKREGDLVNFLIRSGINQDIIKNILRDYFDREFLTPAEINNFSSIYKSNYGFLINGIYYVKMTTYYSSNIIKKLNKLYKGVLFDSIEIISESDYKKIDEKYNQIAIDVKNKNLNIINTSLMELFNEIMQSSFSRVFIDTRMDCYIKYYESFSDKKMTDVFSNLDIGVIKDIIDEMLDEHGFYKNNKKYKIYYRIISETSIEIEMVDYYKKDDELKKLDSFNDIYNGINNISGLFIFSQKEQYNYFYEILNLLTVNDNKRILVLSEDKKQNTATKNINISDINNLKDVDEEIIRDFDVLMIENTNFLNKETFNTINLFLSNSKKVVLFITSKDAINSLASIIYNYPELKRDILIEYLNGIFHISKLPKLCNNCKKEIKLINVDNVRNDYPDLLAKYDKKEPVFIRNYDGCLHCNHGYDGSVGIEQFVKKTGVLISNILNFDITNIKNQLSAENNYRSINDKAESIVMKEKIISIYDVKNKL